MKIECSNCHERFDENLMTRISNRGFTKFLCDPCYIQLKEALDAATKHIQIKTR